MPLLIRVALAALAASAPAAPETGQDRPDYASPRATDGHPDLNGIWQALNEAHYDLSTHITLRTKTARRSRGWSKAARPTRS